MVKKIVKDFAKTQTGNCKMKINRQLGLSKKIHNPPTEGIFAIQKGGDCLKNVLNFYRVSGEGKEGIVNFLWGRGWIFSRTT